MESVLKFSACYVQILGAGGLLVLIAACAAVPNEMAHLPMYGGVDRKTVSAFREADEELRAGSIEAFGTLKNASDVSVDHGFKFVAHKEYSMAMKRFNQAWTLDSANPRVYGGFGTVLLLRGKPCEAIPYFERMLQSGAMSEEVGQRAGEAYSVCAETNPALSPTEKSTYVERARALKK